ncbi:uncharacterized protein TNCV_2487661 [Trichonephila clavipes]|uniref:Mutator-like transposase domain-containing protein n=1 Tax=Trichonephila clavipes TaxID=2585209 RepID=A0A8X6W0K7_TRICX|nr:uncharacterized protein TNCV_2487661 [Trichonephila clavipes]
METVDAYRIFERSEANHGLRYTLYYGDGDSKAFNNVKDIYGYDSIVKYECIGQVQKRVGSRLRKLKKSTKGLGGKVPLWHGGTLNSRRVANPLVWLVEGEEKWEAPGYPQGSLPLNWGGTEQNRTIT